MPLLNPNDTFSTYLRRDGIIPDVIDEFPINGLLGISYGPDKELLGGNPLKVASTQKIPEISVVIRDFPSDPTYTLVLTDPDAPRRGDPTWSEFAHYIVTDLKLDSSKPGEPQILDVSKGTELIPYMGPGPPEKTGFHRYVFILFEGTTNKKPSDRPNWGFGKPGAGVRDWLEGQSLKPVTLNYFVAQNDSDY